VQFKGSLLFVLIACMGTALAVAFSGQNDTPLDVVAPVAKNHSPSSQPGGNQHDQAQPDIRFDLSAIKRTVPKKIETSGLFESKSWYAAPPPPPAASLAPPPPPTAPALPFVFIGRVIDRNVVTLFLSRNDRQYAVKLNDVLDDSYRVDKITDSNAVLTYLPMNIQQTLVFNSTVAVNPTLNASASSTTIQPLVRPQTPAIVH
jgi:hypothetical protein